MVRGFPIQKGTKKENRSTSDYFSDYDVVSPPLSFNIEVIFRKVYLLSKKKYKLYWLNTVIKIIMRNALLLLQKKHIMK